MNKKFSTLVAGLLLATSVGAVSAVDAPNFVKAVQPETAGDFKAEVHYQLTSANGQEVLVMEKINDRFILKLLPYAEADLANSLWLIEPSTNTDDEGGLSFRFKNKRYGLYISYNAKDAAITTGETSYLPGNIAVWKWAEALEGQKFVYGGGLKAAFGAAKDSVVYLDVLQDGTIAAMKEATKNAYSPLTLTPKTAGVVRLGVDDLNSMLGMQDYTTGKLKMNFTPETTGENLFTKNAYRAVSAAGTNSYRQSSLANATEAVEYWETEIKEIEAAFAKIGTMKEYEAAKARLDKLEAALLPAGQHNALFDKVEELQALLKNQKDAVVTAIDAYTETDADVQKGLSSLKTVLANLDAAEDAKNTNLADLALYESARAAILEGRNEKANDVYEDLLAEYWEAIGEYGRIVGEYNTAKGSVDEKLGTLETLLNSQDLDLSDVKDALLTYTANVKYLNNINSALGEAASIPRVGGIFYLIKDIETVKGMTIKPISVKSWDRKKYVLIDAYKAKNTEFAQIQASLEAAINTALNDVLIAYKGQNTEILVAFGECITEWGTVVEKVNDLTTASGQHFLNLAGHITALYWALEQHAENLATVEANIAANKEAQEGLDKEYNELVTARNNVYATLVGFTGDNAEAVKAIIAAYDAQIATYGQLVATKDKLSTANVNGAKFITAFIDFGYFRLAKLELDWSYEMKSMWVIEKAYWNAEVAQWVSLKYADNKYLMVDTAYMTQAAGDQYQTFACNKTFKEIKGLSPAAHDINGRINFRFFYFPSQDSLLIESEGGALKKVDTKYWTNMTPEEVQQGQFGNLVMVKVLADTREVTIQRYEYIKGVHNIPTINTRIGFASVAEQAIKQIPSGVYLIKKVTTNPDLNGKYAVDNFLGTQGYGLTAQKNQDFQHIPAAQWVVVAEDNATTNSIYNRESKDVLEILTGTDYENIQFYTDAQNNIFTMSGDTLEFVPVTDVTTPELGYLALDKVVGEDADYTYYSFDLISGLASDLSIAADSKGNLKVSSEPTYFTVTPIETVDYGYALNNVAVQLKRVIYTISLDGKYVNENADGTYVLSSTPAYFFFKEFKQDADSLCHYALININGHDKIGVDYTSTLLVNEELEDATIHFANENTATFALTKKEIEKYRNVTAEPAYKQFYQADNQESIILCENPENKGAGTTANPSKPTGINFLGQSASDFQIYVDTAYVRNETKRPQYLLGLRPDFTPMEVPCPEDGPEHNHPSTFVPQTAAEYLVVLNDSLANDDAAEKMYLSKEGYTRLAFVAATHRNDSLIMASDNNRIFLGNNARNNVTFQFLYAERPAVEDAEDFYIETQVGARKGWIKILNAIPVIVNNIQDADIFNVENGGDDVANETINSSSISVSGVEGAVIIKGAQGKKVAISNVLGQIVANTVLTSDEATIAAPAGVVVVAVEGEEAVKAIVK